MNLYEIGQTYIDLVNAIESGEIPSEAITDTLDSVKGEFEEKIDNIACIIKSINVEVFAIKQEEENLKDRRSSKEKTVEHLKRYISETMQTVGLKKLETSKNVLSFRKSKQLTIYDEEKFINEYPQFVKVEEKKSIPKKDVTKAIENGEILDFCELVEKQNLQLK